MNSFWEQQQQARSKTGILVFLYLLSVVAIVLVVYLPVVFIVNLGEISLSSPGWLWSWKVFLFTAGPILLIIGGGTVFEMYRLGKGGAALAKQLRAHRMEAPSTPEERVLMNVVEEMAIASGIPAPPVFILEKANESLNCLVAGNSVDDAALLITRGCIDQLNRDELQALVAHEFSHIFNGDMRLNLRAMALVYGILGLAILGLEIMIPDEGFGCLSIALGLPFILLGGIGAIYGSLMQKTISREREYLADASAVQFTRHPEALINVMKKIEAGSSRVKVPAARAADHLFFAESRRPAWIPFFRTHPPMQERRRRIAQLVIHGSPEDSALQKI